MTQEDKCETDEQIRVSFVNGANLWGGSQQQINAICVELSSLGFAASPATLETLRPEFPQFVHLSHLNAPWSYPTFLYCRDNNLPLAVKCIFDEYHMYVSDSQLSEILTYAAFVTVESEDERRRVLCREPGASLKLFITLPGVSSEFHNVTPLLSRSFVHTNGRYVQNKQMAEVVSVCRDLQLPVVTCGKVQERTAFDACASLNYGEILGPLSKTELCDIYNKSRVYVCNSAREQNSTSVNEAIACGCLVVSTHRHSANTEFRSSGYWTYAQANFADVLLAAYNSDTTQENRVCGVSQLSRTLAGMFRSSLIGYVK